MNILKLSFLLGCFFFLYSCGSDEPDPEPCTPGTIEETIVGTWNTPSLNPTVIEGTVTFNADGTGSTSESSAFDRGDLEFDWTYDDTESRVLVGPYIYELISFECDQITFESVGSEIVVTRQ